MRAYADGPTSVVVHRDRCPPPCRVGGHVAVALVFGRGDLSLLGFAGAQGLLETTSNCTTRSVLGPPSAWTPASRATTEDPDRLWSGTEDGSTCGVRSVRDS